VTRGEIPGGSRRIVAFASTVVLSVGATIFSGRVLEDEPPVVGAVAKSMRSTILAEEREFFVHLPEDYEADSSARFPVLYVLDGTSQSGHTADAAQLLARIGSIPPLIVVGVPSPNGETRNRDYTPPGMRLDTDVQGGETGSAGRFLRFLDEELVRRIEADYRTERPRAIAGWSRGGLFVVYSLIERPALFDARFAHSPALWRENDAIVGRLENALADTRIAPGFLYLSLGDGENEKMKAAFDHAAGVLGRRAPASLRWRTDVSAGGSHESNPRLSTPVGLCAWFRPQDPCRAGPTTPRRPPEPSPRGRRP
jgi:hypothetical protein